MRWEIIRVVSPGEIWSRLCFKRIPLAVMWRTGCRKLKKQWSVKPGVWQTMGCIPPKACFCTIELRLIFTFLKDCFKNKRWICNNDCIWPAKVNLLFSPFCKSLSNSWVAIILLRDDHGLDQGCSNGEVEKYSNLKYVLKLKSTEFTEELNER